MPFFLDGNPTSGEISEAINYLLGNSQLTTSTNIETGQVTDATGSVISYLYKYLYVKYADSFDGTVNFTNTPTNRQYYGLRNNDSSIESTNPADYIWYKVSGGFGTTKLLYYSVTGGRRVNIVVSTSAPSILYQPDAGAAIDLDQISGSSGSSARICYAKSTSFALSSTPATYQTSGPSGFPPYNTWGGSETWQATPPTLGVNEALFQSDGIYNPVTNLTTWNSPYLSNLKVGALSAITANMGTLTAGEIIIGSSPAISGTSMTGVGSHLYSDGRFAVGNSSKNIVWNGSSLTINGDIVSYGNINSVATGQIIAGSFNFVPYTSSGTWTCPAYVYKAKITVIGGGGGGGNFIAAGQPGGGGGSGGASISVITVVPGTVYTVTVGSGGGASSAGTASSFSGPGITTITGGGGSGAGTSPNQWSGGDGGTASGGTLNIQGSSGQNGDLTASNSYAAGSGGGAPFIGATTKVSQNGSANSGSGGGGGIFSSTSGGNGGTGLVIIEY